jgi:hypothetical protein
MAKWQAREAGRDGGLHYKLRESRRCECLPREHLSLLSTLSLNLEQGCLSLPGTRDITQTADLRHQVLASVVGEQIPDGGGGGGGLYNLSEFGAKRNHMTPFKGSSLSATWWNLNFFF